MSEEKNKKEEEKSTHIEKLAPKETPEKVKGAGTSAHDQRAQITQKIISQSDVDKAAMNDFTLTVIPARKQKLTELNGERRLKVKVSE
jgi:hypothetical protein